MVKNTLKIVAALVFIASGFVKAVDCVGFSFKLEEYFSPSVFNLPFLEKFALPIAVFVVVVELFTGILLLLNIKAKKVLNVMIALCIFFAFLTFYSAYFNKVTDCGCFGDAVKFTPWQSFFKDIALLFLLLFLRRWESDESLERRFFNFKNLRFNILLVFSALMIFIIFYGIRHEPCRHGRNRAKNSCTEQPICTNFTQRKNYRKNVRKGLSNDQKLTMQKSNKSIAGYHLLMILSSVDGEFAPEEGLLIQKYLAEEFPFKMNLDDELDAIATLQPEDWKKHFEFHAQCFLDDSTEPERKKFLRFAKSLIKADDSVSDDEHEYYLLLKNIWKTPDNQPKKPLL